MIRRSVLGLVAVSFLACGSDPPPPAERPSAPVAQKPAKAAPRADASLLPRKVIFGNPDHAGPRVSYDGKQLASSTPGDLPGDSKVFDLALGSHCEDLGYLQRTSPLPVFEARFAFDALATKWLAE